MSPESAIHSQNRSSVFPLRLSDTGYGIAAVLGAWFGHGETVAIVLGALVCLFVIWPLLIWLTRQFARTTLMLLATLIVATVLGMTLKEAIVRYGMTIPGKVIPLIDHHLKEHGHVPKRLEDIPGVPWMPPLFHYEIWDEGRVFSIRSNLDYWHNWSYVESENRWQHYSM